MFKLHGRTTGDGHHPLFPRPFVTYLRQHYNLLVPESIYDMNSARVNREKI